MDIAISPALTIPAAELSWRFSRASGPGGQHVNTADSRVELGWSVAESRVLSQAQRRRLGQTLGPRLVAGELRVVASIHRSQHHNRREAAERLAALVREGLAPPPPRRRPTRPSRKAKARAKKAKLHRAEIKRLRRRPRPE